MNDSQKKTFDHWPLIFDLVSHPLTDSLGRAIGAYPGELDTRQFPDGESYLRILSDLEGRPCRGLVEEPTNLTSLLKRPNYDQF